MKIDHEFKPLSFDQVKSQNKTIMKKLILSVAFVTGLTMALNAQNPAPQGKKGERMKNATATEKAKHDANRAEKELTLTADQKTKWESASLERINANTPLHEKMKGSTTPEERKTLRAQTKVNADKFDAEVNAFLNGDQKTKFEQMKKDRKAKHKGKDGPDEMDGN